MPLKNKGNLSDENMVEDENGSGYFLVRPGAR